MFEISRIRGQIFSHLNLERQSLREFQKCIAIANKIESKPESDYGLSLSYENMSVVYNRLEMPDSVLYFYNKNKDLLESIDESSVFRNMVNLYSSLGNWHSKKMEYDLAENYFTKSINLAEKYNYPYLSRTYMLMGDMEVSKENEDSALSYYNKALDYLEVTNIKVEYSQIYASLSELYERAGLSDSARFYKDKQSLVENELSKERAKSASKALEVFIKQEKKVQESQKKQILTIVLISSIIFILLALFITQKVHKNLLEKKKSLRNKLDESIRKIEEKEVRAKLLEKKINESFNEIIELAKTNDPAFLLRFTEVYAEETERILQKHPNLTNSELILCALIFLNFTTKDIAAYTFVEHRTVQTKKSRLRKKLNLPPGSDLEIYLYTITKAD